MRAESTAAMAQAIECSRIRSASSSRRSAGKSFESRSPRMRYAGSRITAAATTGPNSDPRPTSSTPATSSAPAAQARFSNSRVQRSFFSSRNFAAEAEMLPAAEVVAGDVDLRRELDTESDPHLRRRSRAKQAQFPQCFSLRSSEPALSEAEGSPVLQAVPYFAIHAGAHRTRLWVNPPEQSRPAQFPVNRF